jgi:hypothetical protein
MNSVILNLVVIRSADLERAASFYAILGPCFVKYHHGNGPEHLTCELGSVVFEIYPRTGDNDSTASIRIGFRVPSVDATVKRLTEIGATVISLPKDSAWGRRAVVDDFDGHRVELTEARSRNG